MLPKNTTQKMQFCFSHIWKRSIIMRAILLKKHAHIDRRSAKSCVTNATNEYTTLTIQWIQSVAIASSSGKDLQDLAKLWPKLDRSLFGLTVYAIWWKNRRSPVIIPVLVYQHKIFHRNITNITAHILLTNKKQEAHQLVGQAKRRVTKNSL